MQEFAVQRDGRRIFGKIAVPEGDGSWPLVVFSHGFGASHVYDSGMEQVFLAHGIAFAAFDFCGGGPDSLSSGSMLEMSVLTEAEDLEAVVDALRARDGIDATRLFLMGSSQGGYVCTLVAAGRPAADFAGLVLFFPAFNIGDDARARLAGDDGSIPETTAVGPHVVGRRYVEDALATDIFAQVARCENDVLIVHGAQDAVVPLEYSQRAARSFAGSCRLVVIEELGHGFRAYPRELHERALALALDFIEAHCG